MKRFSWFCSYIAEFTVCAFCGWLYEILLEFAVYHAYTDRGLLHLPICPIYGVFGMILLLLFRRHNSAVIVFTVSTVLTTLLELGSSYLLQYTIGWVPWDYSDWAWNFEGRISLPSSLIFGVLSLILVKAVHPLMRKFHEKAPDWLVCGLGMLFAVVILGDTLRTLVLPRFL